ncbi:MAG: RNA pyrophosphohydrolase [Alphaproteobacteria bacterium]
MIDGDPSESTDDHDNRPYRPCVGIMLLNREGAVFVGNRIDVPGDHWQMPQGGIDEGEDPVDAAFREVQEETGIDASKVEIIRQSKAWHSYDLPKPLSRKIWRGKYRGQTQCWFAMRFTGQDSDINLNTHKAEFAQWRWVSLEDLPALIVPFKRHTYQQVIAEFQEIV